MKKLLSLLSVLTISGTAIPTTIAASPYQKEEILNSEINSSQTNNLETLNRKKRDVINLKIRVFDENILYFTFSKNTFRAISTYYNNSLGDINVDNRIWNFLENMRNNIYTNQNLSKDFRISRLELELLSKAIYNNFNKINDIVNQTSNNWYSIVLGVNDNHLGKIFSFYPSDADGHLDKETIRDNVIRFTIGAVCGAAGFAVSGPWGAAIAGGTCSVVGSAV